MFSRTFLEIHYVPIFVFFILLINN